AVRSGKQCTVLARISFLPQNIPIFMNCDHLERLNINFIKTFFHGSYENFFVRLRQMSSQAGVPSWGLFIWDNPYVPIFVNSIGTYKQLVALCVDHPVGGRAANAFFANDLLSVWGDFV